MKKLATTLALFSALGLAQSASAITVDGSLSDWGVTVGDSNTSTYDTAFMDANNIDYMIEDTNDNSNGYIVGPYGGGQNYDAEYLGVKKEGGMLYISLLSGQRTDNDLNPGDGYYYIPGDLRFVTTSGTVFGMEFNGMTYDLNNSGLKVGESAGPFAAGDLVRTDDVATQWKDSPLAPQNDVQLIGGTLVGAASMYAYVEPGTDHSILEVAIDMSLFGDTLDTINWAPACDNDQLYVKVPAPQALALMGIGLLGLGAASRRRKNA